MMEVPPHIQAPETIVERAATHRRPRRRLPRRRWPDRRGQVRGRQAPGHRPLRPVRHHPLPGAPQAGLGPHGAELGIPFELLHLNEMGADVAAATARPGREVETPVVPSATGSSTEGADIRRDWTGTAHPRGSSPGARTATSTPVLRRQDARSGCGRLGRGRSPTGPARAALAATDSRSPGRWTDTQGSGRIRAMMPGGYPALMAATPTRARTTPACWIGRSRSWSMKRASRIVATG